MEIGYEFKENKYTNSSCNNSFIRNKNITTPIKVKVVPTLNNNKDLELKIQEVKFLDLKISDWLVNL